MADYGDKLDAEGKLFLSKIGASAARLDLLVQDVLAYSRVAKGEIHLHDVNLDRLIHEAVEAYPQIRQNGSIIIQEPLPAVRAHPAYLMQCVSNLLGNALKFVRPDLSPVVTIRAQEENDSEYIKIWFEDNGIGLRLNISRKYFRFSVAFIPANSMKAPVSVLPSSAKPSSGWVGPLG
jgi:signal transduction histidine kinase